MAQRKNNGRDSDLTAYKLLLNILQLDASITAMWEMSLDVLDEPVLPKAQKGKRLRVEVETHIDAAESALFEAYRALLITLSDKILEEAPAGEKTIAVPPGVTLLEMAAGHNYLLAELFSRLGVGHNPDEMMRFLTGGIPITERMSDAIEPGGFFYRLDQAFRRDLQSIKASESAALQ